VSEDEGFRPPASHASHASHAGNRSDAVAGAAGSEFIPSSQTPLVVFNPGPDVMYPLKGELQDLTRHRGVSVDVRGYGDVMEGASRRT
jgi:pantoate--beta-alanine ligase